MKKAKIFVLTCALVMSLSTAALASDPGTVGKKQIINPTSDPGTVGTDKFYKPAAHDPGTVG